MKSLLRFNLLVLSLFVLPGLNYTNAQEPIGGPYTVDDNTIMLLHFDGDFSNESIYSDNGVEHGTINFLPSPLGPGMGQCIRLKNDAISDSSYVSVPDNDNLDLVGDWTIEGWINVFTFGETSGDHRWVPRLCIKTGDAAFWQPNWWVELWGDNRWFQTGFHTADQANWPAVTSDPNVMVPGAWVHLTFIRDDSRKILIQMVHNQNRELIWFGTMSYADLPVQTPIITEQDVHMGWAGPGSVDSWLDGFIDEVRISNVVRDFAVPPIITDVTQLENQLATVPEYEVDANIMAFAQDGSITSAEIYYSVDGGNTWSTAAMTGSNDEFTGSIPQQPLGTVIDYYVKATDNGGLESESATYTFAVFEYNKMVLYLDFEEGSGAPIDKSIFQNEVTSPRPFEYSNDAVEGNYSYYMHSDEVTNKDSMFLEVDSPFLTSRDFNVDFWFKADSIKQYTRLINRPIAYGNWYQNNYSVRTQDIPVLNARYYVDPDAPNSTQEYIELIGSYEIQTEVWYHVIFKRDSTQAVFELYDANNDLIETVTNDTSVTNNPPIQPNVPLRIGNGGNVDGVRGHEGLMDEVKIYNNFEGVHVNSVEEDDAMPSEYKLLNNYPNPFNPSTLIKFAVPEAGKIELAVYDILGRKIKTLVNGEMHVGTHEAVWNGTNDAGVKVSSGVYFYRLSSDRVSISKKMIYMK